ncbi:MAG: mechanosensitive ion channel family protein [Sedimentisphaerales bacterium]
MNEIFKTFDKLLSYLSTAAIPLAIILAVLITGYIIRKILFSRLAKWHKNSSTKINNIIPPAVKGPFIIWFLMLGIYLALEFSELPPNIVHTAGKILLALGILSVTMVLVNLSTALIRVYSYKFETVLPITSLTQNITRIVVLGIGILIILNTLGISITPIIATLGVGGLAVALALQDTLGNVFAGFYVVMSRQIRVGDYIKLDSGEEGYVTDITWRTTTIRTLPNNIILIPNEKLTKAIATNYCMPEKEMAVLVNVGVHYDSDLKKVEAVTCEVAKEVMKDVPGGVPEFQPFIRYHTFGDFSINFTVILRAKEFVDQYMIKHEFIKRLHERYTKEGIVIPYPIRAINYDQEKAK